MKLRISKVLTISYLIYSSLLYSGTEVGNGGDGVLCKNINGEQFVTLYDYYEALDKYKLEIDLGSENLTYKEKIEYFLKRLNSLNPSRALKYRKAYESFFNNAEFTTKRLIDIPDTGDGRYDENCELIQVAVQRTPRFPEEKKYWDLMDNRSKAGLILHEIVFSEAIESGQKNSINTRYLLSKLSSKNIESISPQDYFNLIRLTMFTTADWKGMQFKVYNSDYPDYIKFSFHNKDMLSYGYLQAKQKIVLFNQDWVTREAQDVSFYKSGIPIKINVSEKNKYRVKLKDGYVDVDNLDRPTQEDFEFFETGYLKELPYRTYATIKTGNFSCINCIVNTLDFFENGTLKTFIKGQASYEQGGKLFLQNKDIAVDELHYTSTGAISKFLLSYSQELISFGRTFMMEGSVALLEEYKMFYFSFKGKVVFTIDNQSIAFGEYAYTSGATFYDDGQLKDSYLFKTQKIFIQGKKRKLCRSIEFYPTGKIKKAESCSKFTLRDQHQNKYKIKNGARFTLYEDGSLNKTYNNR